MLVLSPRASSGILEKSFQLNLMMRKMSTTWRMLILVLRKLSTDTIRRFTFLGLLLSFWYIYVCACSHAFAICLWSKDNVIDAYCGAEDEKVGVWENRLCDYNCWSQLCHNISGQEFVQWRDLDVSDTGASRDSWPDVCPPFQAQAWWYGLDDSINAKYCF